ncbi:MAG: extracellular solute-binding protein [Chloroflexi bacterium]|nr:extracellular solute-binding protein [Chloroflexota bacterium]
MGTRTRNTVLVAAATGALVVSGLPVAAQDKVQIDFWQRQFEDYQQEWFGAQVDAFNASQDAVEVIYTVVPGDAWDAKLVAAQAANVAPDVATTNYGAIKPGVVDGKFANLVDLMSAEAIADIEPWVKEFVTTADGGVYGYPMLVEPSTVLFYRTSLLEAAGLAVPTSWDDLLAAARALNNDEVYGMNIAQTAGDLGWSSWGLQQNAAGHWPIADDWSAGRATEQGFKDLAQFYSTLYQEQLMPQEPTYAYADCSFFGEGQVAMSACGSWALGQLSGNPDWAAVWDDTAIAAFPSIDGDQTRPTSTLGGWTLTVDSKSDQPQAAADFVSWLLAGDPAIMTSFFDAAGYSKYPVRTSVNEALAADPVASANTALSVVTSDILPYAKPEPAYPWDISFAMGTAIEKSMRGGNIDEALAEANATIETVIAQQSLAGTAP